MVRDDVIKLACWWGYARSVGTLARLGTTLLDALAFWHMKKNVKTMDLYVINHRRYLDVIFILLLCLLEVCKYEVH